MIDDIKDGLKFFIQDRDPERWLRFSKKYLESAQITEQSSLLEKQKYFNCVFTVLNIWLWRGKKLAETYLKSLSSIFVQDCEKVKH